MRMQNLIWTAIFTLSLGFFTYAQDDNADECTRYKAIAGYAYKAKEYEKVTRSYIRALKECDGLEMVFFDPFIYSVGQSMRNATDEAIKNAYLDTLIYVYEVGQKQHGIQDRWQVQLGYSYLTQGKPGNMKKADEAFNKGVHFEKEKVNKGYLQLYYQNLFNLWVQEQDAKVKADYKARLIADFFILSDYGNKGNMGADLNDFLAAYLDKAVTDCASILPDINNFMKNLPADKEAKKATVKNFMSLLEDKKCTDSKEYVMLVDTIIAIDPSVDAVIAKGKMLASQKKMSDAVATFRKALGMAENAEQKSDIEYEIAKAYYNAGSYRSAHDAGIAVTGKNSAKGYEISARSVNALMNECGVSTFERKANNYYAVELAEKSGNGSLISSLKAQCPSSNDIFNEDKSVGDQVTLSCWGKSYTIVKY